MSIATHRIREPLLKFGHGQQMEAPKDGFFLFGPLEGPDGRSQCGWASSAPTTALDCHGRWLKRISLHIPGKFDLVMRVRRAFKDTKTLS